jgi:hypothetical protein
MPLVYLIATHLCGDFLLQNHWMQAKGKSSFVCSVHVAAYSLPFWYLCYLGIVPAWAVGLILAEHWLQDRFALHVKWMGFYKQSPPDKWPVGPLCIDQAMHVVFMAAVCLSLPR